MAETTREATRELVAELRAGNGASVRAADLLDWLLDERATWAQALAEEREASRHYQQAADDQTALLCRLNEHLGKLADFSMGRLSDDPWPEPAKPTRRKK